MGVATLVVRPRNWDEYGKTVKTDKRDASELLQNLDRFLAGNTRAFQAGAGSDPFCVLGRDLKSPNGRAKVAP